MDLTQLLKYNFWLVIITSFWGANFLSINIGRVHFFPFRFFFLTMIFILIVNLCAKNKIRLDILKKYKFLVLFFLFWFFYAFVSFFWVPSITLWIKNIAFLFMGMILIWGCIYHLKTFKDLKIFFFIWTVILFCLNLIGFWEIETGNHLVVSGLRSLVLVPTSVFRNQNDFATFLSLSICFLLPLIKNNKKLVVRFYGVILLGSSLYLLITTTSRANIIAIVVAFICWIFTFFKNYTAKGKLFFFILAIPLLGIFIKFFISTSSIQTLVFQLSHRIESGGIRINLIKNSLVFLYNSLGFGVGAGNIEWYMQNKAIFDTQGILNVHNWWVELLANYGIIIFSLYCYLYMTTMRKAIKKIKKATSLWDITFAETIFLGGITFFLASISSSSIMALNFQWLFWGFTFSYLKIRKGNRL